MKNLCCDDHQVLVWFWLTVFGANQIYLSSAQILAQISLNRCEATDSNGECRRSPLCSFHPAATLVCASKELCDIFDCVALFSMMSWKKHRLTRQCLMNVNFCQTYAFFFLWEETTIQTPSAALIPVPSPFLERGLAKLLLSSSCWQGGRFAGTTPYKHQKF